MVTWVLSHDSRLSAFRWLPDHSVPAETFQLRGGGGRGCGVEQSTFTQDIKGVSEGKKIFEVREREKREKEKHSGEGEGLTPSHPMGMNKK